MSVESIACKVESTLQVQPASLQARTLAEAFARRPKLFVKSINIHDETEPRECPVPQLVAVDAESGVFGVDKSTMDIDEEPIAPTYKIRLSGVDGVLIDLQIPTNPPKNPVYNGPVLILTGTETSIRVLVKLLRSWAWKISEVLTDDPSSDSLAAEFG
jgi:hypothetical protein